MGILVRIVVTAAALAVLVLIVDWPALLSLLRGLPASTIAWAVLLGVATHTLLGVRWYVIARRTVPENLPYHVAVYWHASVLGLLTPASLGADAYRVLALGAPNRSRAGVAGLVMRERFMGLVAYLSCFLAALPFLPDSGGSLATIGAAAAATLAAIVGVWLGLVLAARRLTSRLPGRIGNAARNAAAGLSSGTAGENIAALTLTGAACATWFMLVYAIAAPLAPRATFALASASAVLAELVRLLPLSIQGVGLRESAFGYAFHASGETLEVGVATGLVSYLLYNMVMGLGGLLAAVLHRPGSRGTPA